MSDLSDTQRSVSREDEEKAPKFSAASEDHLSEHDLNSGEVFEQKYFGPFERLSYKIDSVGEKVRQRDRHSKNPIVWLNYWMAKLGGETQGADRIPEDQRVDESHWNSAAMWLGANLVISCYALGMLGIGVFGMGFWDSFFCIVFFGLLGCIPVGLLSSFGPETGMRQQTLSRYWFGTIGSKICCLFNVVTCVGWSSVNTIAAANSLHVVNHGGLSLAGAIVIIAMASWVISLFGYRIIHAFERWAWVPNFAVLLVICSRFGMSDKYTSHNSWNTGSFEAANCLSYGAAVYGFAAGWGPYAADYTAYRRKDTSKLALICWLMLIEFVSVVFPMIIGAATGSAMISDPAYKDAYDNQSTGGVLWLILVQDSLHGFGQFCIVLFSLSTIANNIPNIYTFSMSVQSFGMGFQYIPQYALTAVITGIAIGIAIAGAENFSGFLESFMNLISYWISFYFGVVLSEHLFFRRSFKNYRLDVHNRIRYMPPGFAGLFGIGCGVAGFVVGMAQTWYIGPIGKMIGNPEFGGDVGFELAFGFAFVGYFFARLIEYHVLPDASYNFGIEDAWWTFGGRIKLPARKAISPPPSESDF